MSILWVVSLVTVPPVPPTVTFTGMVNLVGVVSVPPVPPVVTFTGMVNFVGVVSVPPVPATVTFTGMLNCVAFITVTVRVPLMLGVLPVWPLMRTEVPVVRLCAVAVVMTVGLAALDEAMVIGANVVMQRRPLMSGVLPLWPAMRTRFPVVSPCAVAVVMTVWEATLEVLMETAGYAGMGTVIAVSTELTEMEVLSVVSASMSRLST